jgi:hypothetical protein
MPLTRKPEGDVTMFKKFTFAALAAGLLFGAIPAEASLTWNGRSWQGIDLNGRSIQGRSLQGRSLQGRSLQGTEHDAASALHVIGVELPATAR